MVRKQLVKGVLCNMGPLIFCNVFVSGFVSGRNMLF